MSKKKKGPKGAAAYLAEVEGRGLSTVMSDAKKSAAARSKRTSSKPHKVKVKSAVSTARSY